MNTRWEVLFKKETKIRLKTKKSKSNYNTL